MLKAPPAIVFLLSLLGALWMSPRQAYPKLQYPQVNHDKPHDILKPQKIETCIKPKPKPNPKTSNPEPQHLNRFYFQASHNCRTFLKPPENPRRSLQRLSHRQNSTPAMASCIVDQDLTLAHKHGFCKGV